MKDGASSSETSRPETRVSLIITVRNEERTIEGLLNSIMGQTRKPDEIVIVDGGSTDGTLGLLRDHERMFAENGLSVLKMIERLGANIAEGRNAAVKASRHDVIVSTDGGCVLDASFLQNIVRYFPEYDVVAGTYLPKSDNDFEYFQGLIVCRDAQKARTLTNMSSRSIAFKKECWEKAGGYPEELCTAEDTVFNMRLKEIGCKFAYASDAIVYWKMRATLGDFIRQFRRYGIGDGRSRTFLRVRAYKVMFAGGMLYLLCLFVLPFFSLKAFAILASIGSLYFLSKGLDLLVRTKRLKALVYGTVLFLLMRVSYFGGLCWGLVSSAKRW